jgi:TolB-like protein
MRRIITITIFLLIAFSGSLFAEKVIGVTAFQNLTGDKSINWLELGIPDSISHKLRNVKEYIVVDRTNVDKIIGNH